MGLHGRHHRERVNRYGRRAALGAVVAGAAATALGGGAIASNHNSNPTPQPTAKIVGGIGTYTNSANAVFAKSGQPLKVEVTGTDVACVVHGSATDKTAPFEFPLTAPATGGQQSIQVTAYNAVNGAGNCHRASATATAAYTVDNAAPELSAALSPAPVNGWNNSNVTLTWTAADTSGIKAGPTPGTDRVVTNTGEVTKTSTATDNLGTAGTGSKVVRLDKAAPTITAAVSPAPNGLGWNNTDVTVSFSCADQAGLSGIAQCTDSARLSAEGAAQPVPGTAKDVAGNTATTSVAVSIDKTAPTLSGQPQGTPRNGWYNGDVTVAWSCADGTGSGVVACPANSTVRGEGPGLSAAQTILDTAGNQTTASSAPVKIDRTAPITGATAPGGWTNADAKIALDASDGGSGVAATFYKVDDDESQTYVDGVTIGDEGEHRLEFWSVDNAGNAEDPTTIDVKVDKTAPTIGHAFDPEPNAAGWNNSDVTVTFACGDGTGSGIGSCSPAQVVSSEGAGQTVEGAAEDRAGNTATDTAVVSLDKTDPTITAEADRDPNGAGWYKDDVTVGFTCGDGLSGVVGCPARAVLGAGRDQSVSREISDVAGNTASARVSGINVDKQAPTIFGRPQGTPQNGWYKDDVTIAWTCADSGDGQSGIAEGACPADDELTGEGDALGISGTVLDVAGNEGLASVEDIRIDRHAPITTARLPTAVAGGWYGGPVSIALPATDNLSQVAATYYKIDGGTEQRYSEAFTFDQNGAHELTFWSLDEAGNAEEPTTVDVKVDTTNPTITGSRPPGNTNGWYNGSVAVTFDCADADSGVKSCSDGVTLEEEGAGQSVTGRVEDLVGNRDSTRVEGIDIDLTAPSITGKATTEPNANGWYRGDVTIGWTCSDSLSGIDGDCPADETITGEGQDLGAGPVSVDDRAGNHGDGSIGGIKIDRTAPSVAFATPANATTVGGDSVTVTLNAADALSRIGSVTVGGGDAGDIGDGTYSRSIGLACGANTIKAVSTDRAGNVSSEATLTVNRSCLFASNVLNPIATSTNSQGNPIANNLNAFKIKSVVPVKFRVFKDAARTDLVTTPQAGSYAKLTVFKYDSTTNTVDSAELVSAGNANTDGLFRWTGSPDHQYIYNLATSGRTAGTYGVQLTLYARDGTQLAQSAKQYLVLRG